VTELSSVPRRTHPLSPFAKAGQGLSGLVLAVFVVARDVPGGFVSRLGLVALLLLAAGALGWISWWRTTFWFDDDGDLRIASGLFYRNERRLQLSRLQSVEIARPLVARLVGLAEVRPEVAGGENAKIALAYLSEGEAMAMRAELLARAAGVRGGHADAPVPQERPLIRVPPTDLAISMLMNHWVIIGGVIGLGFLAVALATGRIGGFVAFVFASGLPGLSLVTGYLAYYDFTVAESADGLRLRSGLLSTRAQTVPPGRVQAVRISQTLLWRWKGWVKVQLNVAGSGGHDSNDGSNGTKGGVILLPVAPVAVAYGLLNRVLPGVDVPGIALAAAPRAARKRAPWQFNQLAVGSDASVFVARGGWLTRRLDVLPHARTQSVRVTQGPWQRLLGLATTHVDSTPGPVAPAAKHRGATEARAIAEAQAVLAGAARAAFRPERWAVRPEEPAQPGEPA